MQRIASTLTVFFEDPFWVGVYERVEDGKLSVCKITFGAEPKDYEVYQFLLEHGHELRFSPPVKAGARAAATPGNPKRMQRAIQRQVRKTGVGTKSQQALQLQHEEAKIARRQKTRAQKEAEARRMFTLKQQKRKEKHKGR
ncbi:MAG TPA: YjdF family protein [Candidatus Limiplasma sp.]|nr:YjdF family protein [Candidatus Limiplasma sp.]